MPKGGKITRRGLGQLINKKQTKSKVYITKAKWITKDQPLTSKSF